MSEIQVGTFYVDRDRTAVMVEVVGTAASAPHWVERVRFTYVGGEQGVPIEVTEAEFLIAFERSHRETRRYGMPVGVVLDDLERSRANERKLAIELIEANQRLQNIRVMIDNWVDYRGDVDASGYSRAAAQCKKAVLAELTKRISFCEHGQPAEWICPACDV